MLIFLEAGNLLYANISYAEHRHKRITAAIRARVYGVNKNWLLLFHVRVQHSIETTFIFKPSSFSKAGRFKFIEKQRLGFKKFVFLFNI